MKEINEYQKRFNQLMESTIGNVKPLVMEQKLTPKPIPITTPINPKIGLSPEEPAKVEDKIITVTPKITINCTKQVITNSDLQKLGDKDAEMKRNEAIINQYCFKK